MTSIKLFMVLALIFVTTFHSIAPAHASEQDSVIQLAIINAVNEWCDLKIKMTSTTLETVQYCRVLKKELVPACFDNKDCAALLEGNEDDMVELSRYTARYLVQNHIIQ